MTEKNSFTGSGHKDAK